MERESAHEVEEFDLEGWEADFFSFGEEDGDEFGEGGVADLAEEQVYK